MFKSVNLKLCTSGQVILFYSSESGTQLTVTEDVDIFPKVSLLVYQTLKPLLLYSTATVFYQPYCEMSRVCRCCRPLVSSLMSMQILSNSPPNSHVQNHLTQRFLTQSKSCGHIMLMRCGCCRPSED